MITFAGGGQVSDADFLGAVDYYKLQQPRQDTIFAGSNDHYFYVEAPSELPVESSQMQISSQISRPSVEPESQGTSESDTVDLRVQAFELNPSAIQTVQDGLKLAEKSQKPASTSESTTEIIDVSETPETIETTTLEVEFETTPTSTPSAEPMIVTASTNFTTDAKKNTEMSVSTSVDSETKILGTSTVLEIRSSEPKVCFSNGKCILARNLK